MRFASLFVFLVLAPAAPSLAQPIFGMCMPAQGDTLYVVAGDGQVHACTVDVRGEACRPIGTTDAPSSMECGGRIGEVWILAGDGGLWRCQDDPRQAQGCSRVHDF